MRPPLSLTYAVHRKLELFDLKLKNVGIVTHSSQASGAYPSLGMSTVDMCTTHIKDIERSLLRSENERREKMCTFIVKMAMTSILGGFS